MKAGQQIDAPGPIILLVSGRFARSYEALDPAARNRCDRALRLLHEGIHKRSLRVRPIESQAPYQELRAGYRDRIVFTRDGDTVVLIDVLDFKQIARLMARAERSV